MSNTDKPIMRCGAGCGTAHDCAFPDCVDIEATLETLKANESEIAELTKQRDELHELLDWFVNAPDLHKREAAAIMGMPEALNPECPYRRARNALSTQEANK